MSSRPSALAKYSSLSRSTAAETGVKWASTCECVNQRAEQTSASHCATCGCSGPEQRDGAVQNRTVVIPHPPCPYNPLLPTVPIPLPSLPRLPYTPGRTGVGAMRPQRPARPGQCNNDQAGGRSEYGGFRLHTWVLQCHPLLVGYKQGALCPVVHQPPDCASPFPKPAHTHTHTSTNERMVPVATSTHDRRPDPAARSVTSSRPLSDAAAAEAAAVTLTTLSPCNPILSRKASTATGSGRGNTLSRSPGSYAAMAPEPARDSSMCLKSDEVREEREAVKQSRGWG